jgi:hypothetical protein
MMTSSSLTPALASACSAPARSRSVMYALKRATTTPIRSPLPSSEPVISRAIVGSER